MEQWESLEKLLFYGAKAVSCHLSSDSIQTFLLFLRELTKWNKRVNLTGLKNEIDMVIELFVDSLACGIALSREKKETIIDIGSGAGFPGIPLKIAYPELQVTLLEPRLKKTSFLHHVIGTLSLNEVKVVSRSVQDLYKNGSFSFIYDKVIARAIKPDSIFPEARFLLDKSGEVILCRSKSLGSCDQRWGMRIDRELDYELPYEYGKRVLSILKPIR